MQILLRSVVLAVATTCVGLGIAQMYGRVLASYYIVLVLVGYSNTLLPMRWRGWLLALVSVSATAGCAVAARLPELVQLIFAPVYKCAELPLDAVGRLLGPEFWTAIFFWDVDMVRPMVIVYFWSGIAISIATSLLAQKARVLLSGRRQVGSDASGEIKGDIKGTQTS